MGVLRPPPFTLGVDTSGSITRVQAEAIYARGARFAIRSLAVPDGSVHPAVPTAIEIAALHEVGLAVGLYQTFQTAELTTLQAAKDGASAAQQAKALGYPPGCTIYGDSEGHAQTSASAEVAYWNVWASAVKDGGYLAGLYVGPGPKMSGAELGQLPDVHAYWMAAAAQMPYPFPRGYQMFQLNPTNVAVAGEAFDFDVIQEDFRGGLPILWGP
jgi:hypothetical protein